MENLLITGASGFLGKCVLDKLLEDSNYFSYVLLRARSDHKLFNQKFGKAKNLKIIVVNSESDLYEKISPLRIDSILHLATNYGQNGEWISEIIKSNLTLPLTLLQMAENVGATHFINIDSFYNKPGNIQDKLFDYSVSKAALKPWFEKYSKNIKISNLVLEHMFGPHDAPHKFIPKLITSARKSYSDGLVLTPGKQERDFIFVEDVATAIKIVLEKNLNVRYEYSDIAVGTGIVTNLVELATIVNEILNVRVEAPFGTIPYPSNEIMKSVADISFLASLGWLPSFSLRDGLKKTIMEVV